MLRPLILLTAAAPVCGLTGPNAAAPAAPPAAVVQVHDSVPVPAATLVRALEAASAVLATAGVEIGWAGAASEPLDPPDRVPVRRLRLVAAPARPAGRGLPLGDAWIGRDTGAGILATVYVDRVRALAAAAAIDPAVLLGRAIAHEIGHLLLGSTTHPSAGVMRARWSFDEIARDDPADWRFTPADAREIRRRLREQAAAGRW